MTTKIAIKREKSQACSNSAKRESFRASLNQPIRRLCSFRVVMMLLVILLTTATARAETIETYYVDASGSSHNVIATVLTGNETSLGTANSNTLYVVNSNISHSYTIECKGHVILILADDCTMTASAGINIAKGFTLNIYSQQGGSGILTINGMSGSYDAGGNGINGDVIVNGSTINITGGDGSDGSAPDDRNGKVGGMGINGSLTVNGGTMNITGGKGGKGYRSFHTELISYDGGKGGMGSYGIKGSLTVNGGTINITGGAGGNGGDKYGRVSDPSKGGNGGNGAEGIKGTLTVNGGFITINGGNGGEGGSDIRGICTGIPGSAGQAIDGTVTFDAATTLMEQSDDQSTWSNLASGSTSTKRYIRSGESFTVSDDMYTIWNATGWDLFCDLIEGGESFSGKTVKLGANITVTRIAGSGAGSNLTASDRPFCGTFLGGGNTLTFNYGTAGTPADENNIAPFRYVNNATISGLHVCGDIYTQHVHCGGIVGMAYGTTNITDCHSSVNIISSINGDGTHGGIMSCSWTGSTTNISGCLFDGSIQSADGYTTNQCGGFVGWRNATINVTNSLLTADLSTIVDPEGLQYPSCTFVRNGSAGSNCYYMQSLGTVQGKAARTVTAGDNVTIDAIAPVGNATATYTVSGITAYAKGISYDGTFYYGSGDDVSLTLSHTDREGYIFSGYEASTGTLTESGNTYTLTMSDADVIVSAIFEKDNPLKGDVNGDGVVDISDVVAMVNYILGNSNSSFIFANADLDENGQIDISDVVAIVNLILNGTGN